MRNNVAAGSDVSEKNGNANHIFWGAFFSFILQCKTVFDFTMCIFYQYAGIWYVFPDEPIGASYGVVKTMQKDEAKRTPITEFTNNVVHSNRVVSISIQSTIEQILQWIKH